MSKQEITLTPVSGGACCTPISDAALDPAAAAEGAAVFKALADPIRLRLLSMIASAAGEICVCDLTPQFDVSGPTISHHLRCSARPAWSTANAAEPGSTTGPSHERLEWISTLIATPAPLS